MNNKPDIILTKLEQADRCLNGYSKDGTQKTHIGTYDGGVVSFIEGGAQRRPYPSVIRRMALALFDGSAFPIESYTNYDIYPELFERARDLFVTWGFSTTLAGNLAFANGSLQLFNSFLRSAFNRGDLILTGKSFYHAFSRPPFNCGLTLKAVETQRKNDYKLTARDLENWIQNNPDQKPRGIVISNPSPVGAIYNEQELKDLAQCVLRHNLLVYMDSVYKGAEYDGKQHPSLANFTGMENRVVTAMSVSKIHGCANLRIGWACGPKNLIDKMVKATVDEITTLCQLNQIGAAEALNTPLEYVRRNALEAQKRATLISNLAAVLQSRLQQRYIAPKGLPFVQVETMPGAGYSILLSFPAMKGLSLKSGEIIENDLDLTKYFLGYGVAVSPTSSTGFENECCVRLAFAEVGPPYARQVTQDQELAETLAVLTSATSHGNGTHQSGYETEASIQVEEAICAAFSETRAVIQNVFETRIYNALEDLLILNHLEVAVKCHA